PAFLAEYEKVNADFKARRRKAAAESERKPATEASPAKTDPPYLSEMPSVERVMDDMKISDARMTVARQMAALDLLHVIVAQMSGPRAEQDELTADEKRLIDQYVDGFHKIEESFGDAPGQKLAYL